MIQYEVGESTHFCLLLLLLLHIVWLGVIKQKKKVWCVHTMLVIAFILT